MTKSIQDRVPMELFNLKEELFIQMKMKKKVDAYKFITDAVKQPVINLAKNKKGQLLDIVTFGVIIAVFLIAIGITIFTLNAFNTIYSQSEPDATLRANLNTNVQSTSNWWDFSFALFFFLYLIVLIAINFYLATQNIMIIFQIVFLLIVGILFVAMHNIANTITAAFPTVFSVTSMPLTFFIVDKFYYIIMVFYLFSFMTLFMKPNTSTGGV